MELSEADIELLEDIYHNTNEWWHVDNMHKLLELIVKLRENQANKMQN